MSEETGNRIVKLVNFFAAHPGESFSLSELVEHLSLSLGSAHRALKALTDAGYLYRHPKLKTYSLGLALVAIGQAALERHPAVNLARAEMTSLTEAFGLPCVATALVNDELISLVKTSPAYGDPASRRVGERRPFVPPLGFGHAAWIKPQALDAYLARGDSDSATRDEIMQAIDIVRHRGYAMAADGPAAKSVWQRIWDDAANIREEHDWTQMRGLFAGLSRDEFQILALRPTRPIRLAYISAPVFSPIGDAVLSISVSGFTESLDANAIAQLAERLCNAAANVTRQIHGRAPKRL